MKFFKIQIALLIAATLFNSRPAIGEVGDATKAGAAAALGGAVVKKIADKNAQEHLSHAEGTAMKFQQPIEPSPGSTTAERQKIEKKNVKIAKDNHARATRIVSHYRKGERLRWRGRRGALVGMALAAVGVGKDTMDIVQSDCEYSIQLCERLVQLTNQSESAQGSTANSTQKSVENTSAH